MRHVHLCDPQLFGLGGHYLNHDAQLVRELQRRHVPVSLYARRGCQVTCEGLAPQPVFTHDIFQEAAGDPEVWAMENFHALNPVFLGDLRQLGPERFTSDDLVYFPNLLQNQLYAVAQWLDRIPADRRPAVAVMLRFLNHKMLYMQARKHVEMIPLYYRYAARVLARVQPRSFLCADTRELAEAYREITGLPVLELPNPMDVSGLDAAPAVPPPDARPVVVYQGSTSTIRGFHLLPEIIERCAKLQPRPRFVVQIQNPEGARSMNLGPVLDHLHRLAGDDLRLVPGALTAADFLGMLREADIVLLPYGPDFYGHGSSGVFTESASLGKVVVVPAGTMAARQGREYGLGVVAAAKWTGPSLADAVVEAVRRLPELQARAAEAAPRFRRENCAQALWDRLLGAAFPGDRSGSVVPPGVPAAGISETIARACAATAA
jgi:glycosyltransferase involved in cell wall biosynthesis